MSVKKLLWLGQGIMFKYIIVVGTLFSTIGITAGTVTEKVRDARTLIAAATRNLGQHTLAHA